MRDGVSAIQLGSEFDAFLFAPIDSEENGLMLSVVSALARLDIDPWREVAELTRMTKRAASQRLASLIAAVPDVSATRCLPTTIANRLIELLPRGDTSGSGPILGMKPTQSHSGGARLLAINVILMVGILCAQWAFASFMPPTHTEAVQVPNTGTTQPTATPTPQQSRGAQTIG